VNTLHPNRIAAEAIAEGLIPELAGYALARREVKYGENSRVDLVLSAPDRPECYVEVKSVTLNRGGGLAEWPDSVSARGARHVLELQTIVAGGARAVILFLVQRTDCDRFAIAADLDPGFARALTLAMAGGIEVLAYGCEIDPGGIRLGRRLAMRSESGGR
jgi:sugar fermentation stimulation protein A